MRSSFARKPSDPPAGQLGNGDVIGLENSGRNPEIEEVFGALALLLNGGGVGQLKSIAQELNTAFGGRENAVRSIITQLGTFMGQLDANKESIVTALENVNRLPLELRRQDGTIKAPWTTSRQRSSRSTGSARTWSGCFRRWRTSARSACA